MGGGRVLCIESPRPIGTALLGRRIPFAERYSMAFFLNPDYALPVEPLPGCEVEGKWSSVERGEKMTAGDWLLKRAALEYGYTHIKVCLLIRHPVDLIRYD